MDATRGRKAHEIATAVIRRKDGSSRQILKQKDEQVDGERVVTVLIDKFFYAGTFTTDDGEVISGRGECKRWTQAYTAKELAEVAIANAKAKIQNWRN